VIIRTAPTVPTQRAFIGREEVEVAVYEGEFDQACEICLARPSAILVELRGPEFESLEKRGENGDLEPIARRYFCVEHIAAADMVFRSYLVE